MPESRLIGPLRAALTTLLAVCLLAVCTGDAHAYSRTGVYQTFGQLPRDWTSPYPLMDGVPYVDYGTFIARNPVTAAQYGLANYSIYQHYHAPRRLRIARHIADWLVFTQHSDGKWTYSFPEPAPGGTGTLAPGWSSSLAQAQALSLLERVYATTHDPAYLKSITRGLTPLTRRVARGGLNRVYRGGLIFEEYPTPTINFSFNGDLQTLLGLYDVEPLDPSARQLFTDGVRSIARDLPIFDSHQGFSWYSLASRTEAPAGYNPAIRSELNILTAVTGRTIFRRYARIWTAP